MRYSELNPADRAAVDRKLGVTRKKRTTQVAIEGAFRGSCHACGEPFATQAEWHRHVAANFPWSRSTRSDRRCRVSRPTLDANGLIVDLFAGARGWSQGLRMLGLDDLGIEIDAAACATAMAAGHATEHADVVAMDPRDYTGAVGLIASPPCPPWSSAGPKEGHDDPRAALVWEPLRWIAHLRPEWVALEQVRHAEHVWRCYEPALQALGYTTKVGLVDAADYGVPQNRVRAVLRASKYRCQLARPTHADGASLFNERPHVTMAEALELGPGWEYDSGQNSTIGGGLKERYVRSCDRPAGTVTGQTTSQWVLRRGDERRKLTLADSARLQSFPDDYPFQGSPEERSQQIGNAVPPLLAAHVIGSLIGVELRRAA